jgi:predicted transcriptional regulator
VNITKFRQAGVFELLSMLLKKEMKITDITQEIHQQSAYKTISILLALDLVKVERREYNAKFYILTDKGKKVATKLAEIEELLQED